MESACISSIALAPVMIDTSLLSKANGVFDYLADIPRMRTLDICLVTQRILL